MYRNKGVRQCIFESFLSNAKTSNLPILLVPICIPVKCPFANHKNERILISQNSSCLRFKCLLEIWDKVREKWREGENEGGGDRERESKIEKDRETEKEPQREWATESTGERER